MLELSRRMEFSASHRLWRDDWSEARNLETFGPEAGRCVYGHNYALEVTLAGSPDPETGMVIDLKELKDIMDREVGERFDHRSLNEDTSYFATQAPTPENLARVIFELLDEAIPAAMLCRVRLRPTPDLEVEVWR